MATLDGTWTYGYDTIGELTSAVFVSTNPAIPSQSLAYTYDANGNRTQTVINGATTTYVTNNLNQYTTVGNTTYQYDKDGNLVSTTNTSGTTTYTYDSLNRLVSVTTPTDTWIYSYNALGQRVATIHNGQLTTNLIDPTGLGNVVGTYNSSGNVVADYTYGLGLVSEVTAMRERLLSIRRPWFNCRSDELDLWNCEQLQLSAVRRHAQFYRHGRQSVHVRRPVRRKPRRQRPLQHGRTQL